MKITTKLKVAAWVPALMALVIGLVLLFSYRMLGESHGKMVAAHRIMNSLNQLNSVGSSYILYHEERPKQQFLLEHDSFTTLITSIRLRDEEQERLAAGLRQMSESMRKTFLKLVSSHERPGSADSALVREAKERLAAQFTIRLRDMLSHALRLEALIDNQATTTQGRINALVLLLIFATTVPLTIVLIGMMRNINRSLATLRKGTEVIASGDLNHRIGLSAPDEIGELSFSFDRMTGQLKETTVSRDALEKEVEDRRRAEEALRQQREWLRIVLTSIGDAVMAADTSGRITFVNPVASALTGWQPEEAEGQPIQEVFRIINERTHEPAEDIVKAALREGRGVSLANQTALIARDGREIPIEHSAAPIKDSSGNVSGVVLVFHDVTERRRAQTALRESEHRYRSLFETMSEGFALHEILCDKKGHPCDYRFLDVNPAFERQTGLKSLDIVGRTLREVLPQAEPFWVERYGRVALTGQPDHFEQWSKALGRCYDVSAFQAEPGRFAVLFLDITERKRAEESIKQRTLELQLLTETLEQRVAEQTAEIRRAYDSVKAERQRLYDVLETLPAYVVLLSPDYRVPFANRFFIERFGESHGKRCFEYLFGRTEACEICETYKVLKTKAPNHWEWTGPDGRLYDIHDFPFTDTDGSFLIMEMGIDITERKRAEDALREANEKLREEMAARLRLVAAVEQAGEGAAITNPEGIIDYVNPAFERISGIGGQEARGKSYYDVLGDEDLKKKVQGIAASEETWSGRVTRKSDGQSLELDVTFSPIRDGSGTVINYLAMERDVTQEVRLEQHLRQMQKMEALGTLAGGIAHDFNNILNPIFINTELVLLDAPPGSPMRPPLQLVLQAAERGKNLVKQIITFSRQREREAKPLKAEPLIKEALKFLRASLPSTVEIREKIQRETGFILGDPTQVHQVVMNLCSNAAYAMREQGGVLEVSLAEVEVDEDMARLHPDLNPGPYLRLTVSDTGVGMTKEVLERAFDPFFTTKKPGEGSGMGLSVVHGIVRNAKGAITVYSEVGKGSTFNIFMPRVETKGSPLKVSPGPVATGRERVLLVDDEEVQVQSIRNMLERLGYKVVTMTDSVEALSLFRKDPRAFDLVITDQTMPQMTGVRLAEELLRVRPDLPIILCTGFSELVDANGAQALGIRQFLMKPFSLRDMAETIKRALQEN